MSDPTWTGLASDCEVLPVVAYWRPEGKMVKKHYLEYPFPWGPLNIPQEGLKLPLPDNQELQLFLSGNRLEHRVITAGETEEENPFDVTILSAPGELVYQPMLPDLSIVLRSAHDLHILPSGSTEILIPIPLVPAVTVKMDEKNTQTVLRLPVTSMSKTWFGDPVSGEPAYALNTQFDIGSTPGVPDPWVSLCSLTITNASSESLQFKRLIMRILYLSLYTGAERLYSNKLTVRFKGHDQVSQIQISSKMPDVGEPVMRICEPQRRKDKELLEKSFSFIRSLYTF